MLDEISRQTKRRCLSAPALSNFSLMAQIKSRPAHEVIESIAQLYDARWRVRQGRQGAEVYFWLPPHKLSEPAKLRAKDDAIFEQRLIAAFQLVLNPPTKEIAREVNKYYIRNQAAAAIFFSLSPERQRDALRKGIEPIPFVQFPLQVQQVILKGFRNAYPDPEVARKQAEAIHRGEKPSGVIVTLDPQSFAPFCKFGLRPMGVGWDRSFCISVVPLTPQERARLGLPEPRIKHLPGSTTSVHWTRWTHPYSDTVRWQRMGEVQRIAGMKDTDPQLDRPLNREGEQLWEQYATPIAVQEGTPPLKKPLEQLALIGDVDVLADIIDEPRIRGANVRPTTWRHLYNLFAFEFGYMWWKRNDVLLWRHMDWYRWLPLDKHPDYYSPRDLLPKELLNTWKVSRQKNEGRLPLSEVAAIASCYDDQLAWLEKQGFPEASKVMTEPTRILLVLYATLSDSEQEQAQSKEGLLLAELDRAQFQMLADTAVLSDIGKALLQKSEGARLLVEEKQYNGKRAVDFRFRLLSGEEKKVTIGL